MTAYTSAIVRATSYGEAELERALNEAISAIDALDFVKPGIRIALKVNLAAGKAPEFAVCTDPRIVSAFTKLLIERGAEVIVGDSPGGLYNEAFLNHTYQASHMTDVESSGAKLNHDFSQNEALVSDGVALKRFAHTAWLDKCDAIISFAKLKTHGMMGMTGAVKNFYGTVPGTVKLEYHYQHPNHDEFANMLIDICEYNKPVLSIIDGVLIMDGNGPTAGRPRDGGLIIMSRSPYEADVLGARALTVPPEEVPVLEHAKKRGLVSLPLDSRAVYGNVDDFIIENVELVPRREIDSVNNMRGVTRAFAKMVLARRPKADRRECVGCGLCANLCPAKAITMKNKLPEIDRRKCIRCFCCQEFCPKGAMKVSRTFIAKMLNK